MFVGPFERHSNMLPWKETGAKVTLVVLSAPRFESRRRQPEERISRDKTVVSPRFLYYSSLIE